MNSIKPLTVLRKINTFLAIKGFFDFLPDSVFLKMRYRLCMGHPLNLDKPKTFTEKIQWLKIHNRKHEQTLMVDKVLAKKYVASKIGEEYIVPTIGVWESADEINFDELPDQFVLKCNHDSGGVVICKDKGELNKTAAVNKLNRAMKRNSYRAAREWPYKNVERRILAEQYLEDEQSGELKDYKFFAFNGEVKALFIASDRQNPAEETKFDFFDSEFNHLPIINGHPNSCHLPAKPQNFDLMKTLAGRLSQGFPQLRVDFYEVNDRVYFGELTFSHYGGFVPFYPQEWDEVFGEWISIDVDNQ